MKLITRSEWGAADAKFRRSLSTTHNGWFWHWLGVGYPEAATDKQILQGIQRYHMHTKGWSDVAYSFAVGRETNADGTAKAYELRGWDIAGGHTQGYNNTSMAICFLIGEGESPTPAMFRAAYEIMAQRPDMSGPRSHRDVGTTQCPGDEIAAEANNPQHKESPMTPTKAEAAVKALYISILGRAADNEGLKFWVSEVVNEARTLSDVRHEFVVVRLAALQAQLDAVLVRLSSPQAGGVSVEKVAEQAYRLFLDDLVAL